MNYIFFIAILIIFTAFYFILGILASQKIKTSADYFLAGRNLGLVPVTFTLIATQLGGGMLLGTSQEAYQIGIWGILYTLGMSIGFLVLGCGLASRLQRLGVETTAQLFETHYKSVTLKKVASLFSIITLCGLFIGQIVASRTIIAGLGFSNDYVFGLFWLFIIAGASVGGLYAVAETDLYQVLYVAIFFTTLFIYILWQDPLSFTNLFSSKFSSFNSLPPARLSNTFGILIMPALFSLIEQDLAQRFFAARNGRIAAFAALSASFFMLLFSLIPIYFGIQARALGIIVPTDASPLIPFIKYATNDIVVVLALCGIIAAISSTADSLLCAISSNIAQDFDFSLFGSNRLKISRIITFLIGGAALILSYFIPQNIIGILIGSYELSVSCLLIPLLASYYYDNLNKNAAWGAIIFGFLGFIVGKLYFFYIPKEIVALCLSGIGYLIGRKI